MQRSLWLFAVFHNNAFIYDVKSDHHTLEQGMPVLTIKSSRSPIEESRGKHRYYLWWATEVTAFLFIVRWGILDSVSTCRERSVPQDCLQRHPCNSCALNTHITVSSHARYSRSGKNTQFHSEKMYDNEVNFFYLKMSLQFCFYKVRHLFFMFNRIL